MGVVVLVAVGLTSRDRLFETWWLYRLEYGDSKERRDAAERLGEIGSLRALPRLLRGLADDRPVTLGTGAVLGAVFVPDGNVLVASDFDGDGQLDLLVPNTGTILSTNEILRFCTCPEFRFIHLPVDPAYLQAVLKITQRRTGETVSFLINTLDAKDEGTGVRLVAAALLGRLGRGARMAIPALEKAYDDEDDENLRHVARDALMDIQRADPKL